MDFRGLFKDTNANAFLTFIVRAPSQRQPKRETTHLLDTTANVLFGTAIQEQADELYDKLQRINTLTDREPILLSVHSSTLKMTVREMRAMKETLTKLEATSIVSAAIIKELSL